MWVLLGREPSMTQGATASDHEDHGIAHLAGEVNSKGLTKSRGRLSASQQLSPGSDKKKSQSLGAPLGSDPPPSLALSFSAPALGRQWSDLLIGKFSGCKILFLRRRSRTWGGPLFITMLITISVAQVPC